MAVLQPRGDETDGCGVCGCMEPERSPGVMRPPPVATTKTYCMKPVGACDRTSEREACYLDEGHEGPCAAPDESERGR